MAVGARRAASFPAAIVRSEAALPLGLLAPTVIFLSLLILVPIAQAVLLSFQAADGTFGLDAYKTMFNDTAFAESFRNTILLLIAIVPIQMVLALAMASANGQQSFKTADEAVGKVSHALLQSSAPGTDIDALLRSLDRWQGDVTHTRRDGTRILVESSHVVHRAENGDVLGILEINRDITDRQRMIDELGRNAVDLAAAD